MDEADSAIAIIPGESFRWRPRVQFIDTFRTRRAAVNYAYQYGYNLIVERNEGSSALFDVMKDPDGSCTAGLDLQLLKTEEALVEPPPISWTALMLSTLWGFAKQIAALLATLSARQIVPLSRRVAAVTRTYLRKMAPLSRRVAAVANTCLHKTDPISRRAAAAASVYLRKMVPLSRRVAAVASMYLRKTIPLSRRAAAVISTYLREVVSLFRQTAAFARLYLREIAPILRNAAARCWTDSKRASHRENWAVAASHHSDPTQLR